MSEEQYKTYVEALPYFVKVSGSLRSSMEKINKQEVEEKEKYIKKAVAEKVDQDSVISNVLLLHQESEHTKRKRRWLLTTGILSIAATTAGLLPSEIPFFGVELQPANQNAIIYLAMGILGYFVVGFWLGVRFDSFHSVAERHKSIREFYQWIADAKVREVWKHNSDAVSVFRVYALLFRKQPGLMVMLFLRAAYDVYLPFAIAAYAMWCLYSYPRIIPL